MHREVLNMPDLSRVSCPCAYVSRYSHGPPVFVPVSLSLSKGLCYHCEMGPGPHPSETLVESVSHWLLGLTWQCARDRSELAAFYLSEIHLSKRSLHGCLPRSLCTLLRVLVGLVQDGWEVIWTQPTGDTHC